MEFKPSKTKGTAAKQVETYLSTNGYVPSKRHAAGSGFYVHPVTKKEVYVTHYKTGVSHIDENTSSTKGILESTDSFIKCIVEKYSLNEE